MASLTVPDEVTFATFTVVTSTSAFPISFAVFEKANLTVLVDGVALTQSDFSFAGTILDGGGYQGGTVTLNTAVSGVTVRIERNIAPERASNYAPSASVPVRSVDMALNRQMAVTQDIHRRQGDLEEYVSGETGALAASVNEAQAHALAAQASADEAEADALQTAADRVQTGLDRVQTGLDRVQTGLDADATAADRVATGLDRAAAAAHAAAAQVARTGAETAAFAAGAPLYTVMPTAPFTGVPSPFLLAVAGAGTAIYEHDGSTATFFDWLGTVVFDTVAVLLASTGDLGGAGNTVVAGGYRYQVVSSGEHVTTAGGVKLIVLPDPDGYHLEAFGADMTGSASANTILTTAMGVALAATRDLVVANGRPRISTSMTVTSALNVRQGGGFSLDSGVTLSIGNRFTAGRYSVFTGAGTGPTFLANTVDAIYPEWFGAVALSPSATPVDSYPALAAAYAAASRGIFGLTYEVELGQGIYYQGTEVGVPAPGVFAVRGQGLSTQIRPMNTGAGFPVSIFTFTSSTIDSRIADMTIFCGGTSRPTKFAIRANVEMKHTNIVNVNFAYASIAGILSADWDNAFCLLEFAFCGTGIWLAASANNNDITIDICRFISCDVGVATGPGANIRITNGQFQAALVAPFTKTHMYIFAGSGVSIENNYCESQLSGGMAGMTFTVPETITIWADIIFNGSRYYTDDLGSSITATLAQTSNASGSLADVSNCLFGSPSNYQAGAGGTGYTAGAVTLVAAGGSSGTGASGTAAVNSGNVTGVSSITGGTGWQLGDRVTITQGGNTTATATVSNITTNNAISAITLGSAAGIYPGNCGALAIRSSVFANSYFVLFNDTTVCDPRRVTMTQCRRPNNGLDFLIVGSDTSIVKAPLGNFLIDNIGYQTMAGGGSASYSIRNYYPNSFTFTPTVSTFLRQDFQYQGYNEYRLTLNASQQTSDAITGTLLIASSGVNNAELVSRRVYLSCLKVESTSNVKLQITMSFTNGTSTVTRSNYTDSTSFTKSAGFGREECSIHIGPLGGTLTWSIRVIAATAASQFVSILGHPILTVAGWGVEQYPRHTLNGPLYGSVSWDPALIAAGGNEELDVQVNGVRTGDRVVFGLPNVSPTGCFFTARASGNNTVKLRWDNPTASGVNLGSGTYAIEARVDK